MKPAAGSDRLIDDVERIVVASVALTARALSDVAPELTLAQWRVLVLIDRPDGMAVGAIAESLGAKIAAVSRLVGRLNQRGLVSSRRADRDGRVVLVSLTPFGEELRTRIVTRRRAELSTMLAQAGLTADAQPAIERLAASLGAPA